MTETTPMDEDGISLSEAVRTLRTELQEAMHASENETIRFKLDSITLELEVAAKLSRDVNGKLSLWQVMSVGGSRKNENSATHRVILNLKPHDVSMRQPRNIEIGDDM